MKHRARTNPKKDKKHFKVVANKIKKINLSSKPQRGGTRL